MTATTQGPLLTALIAVSVPLFFGLGALWTSAEAALRRASLVATTSAVAALCASLLYVVTAQPGLSDTRPRLLELVRLDGVTMIMLLLVCSIALVIVRFSRTYLEAEPNREGYARALLSTLSAVTTLVVSNHLGVIAVAWFATSLSLHQLLTFYRDRPRALVAAHKKFLLSRLADVCVFAAVALFGFTAGSLELDALLGWAAERPELTTEAHAAMVLLVLAVILRSAQLPFHGWLTQVMEAPTPVSALLHAGVVNIGGLVLLRLSPLLSEAPLAQALLVAVGTSTAVLAALVMTTRVSIKVALAWSTCAQLGFMLVEIGLGAYSLALLHLVAHSLYKAHAFLSSGSTVEQFRTRQLAAEIGTPSAARTVLATLVPLAALATLSFALPEAIGLREASFVHSLPLLLLLCASFGSLSARASAAGLPSTGVWLRVAAVLAAYAVFHQLFEHVVPNVPAGAHLSVLAVLGLISLFVAETWLRTRPHGRFARALRPRLFAGFHLDELFTRWTFRLWPPRMPARDRSLEALSANANREV
jgi:NAD(P)H-quinone oxidoreductase subunit 5